MKKIGERIARLATAVAGFPFFAVVGGLIGLTWAVALPDIVGWASDFYDGVRPIVRVQSEIVQRSLNSVTVHMSGEKLRGDECRLMTIYAYTIDSGGKSFDANITRLDRPRDGRQRERGTYDFGVWEIWPVDATAKSVEVWLHHSCRGRDVLTKVVSLKLNNPPA